jgi:hypothetical protein
LCIEKYNHSEPNIFTIPCPMKTILTLLMLSLFVLTASAQTNNDCTLKPTDCSEVFISYFELNGFTETSGCSQNINTLPQPPITTLVRGARYNFQVNTSSTSSQIAIYLDINKNGRFSDRNEMLFSSTSTANQFNGILNIARDLQPGVYRLRVKASNNIQMQNSDGCINYADGEVQEYAIRIAALQMAQPTILSSTELCKFNTLSFSTALNNIGQGFLPPSNQYIIQFAGAVSGFNTWNEVLRISSNQISTVNVPISASINPDFYRVRVLATTTDVVMSPSETFAVNDNSSAPTITTPNLFVCSVQNRTISVSGGCTSYRWYRSADTLTPLGNTSSSFTINNVDKDTTHYVSCFNISNGCESKKTKVTVKFVNTTVNDFSPSAGVRGFTQIAITGQNLQYVKQINVGPASTNNFTLSNNNETLFFTIPPTAASGMVSVQTDCETQNLGNLTVSIERVAPVEITPAENTFEGEVLLTMTSATPGATIYYTTNGNNPVIGSSFTRTYTEPVLINRTTTIRALAALPGMTNSVITIKNVTITNPNFIEPVTIEPAPGTYNTAKTCTLSSATPGVTIYYTLNGTVPLIGSSATSEYLHPFTISDPRSNVRALAIKNGNSSTHTSFVYFITNSDTVAKPVITNPLDEDNYAGPSVNLELATATPGAQIYYTLNGSRVVIGSASTFLYSTPIPLAVSTMITARGFKTDVVPSNSLRTYVRVGEPPARRAFFNSEENHIATIEPVVYPNPAQNTVHIEHLDSKHVYGIRMFNINGKEISLSKLIQNDLDNRITLQLGSLPKGMYVLKFNTPDFTGERKVILQ